jgi:hypothetical protein
MLQCVYNICSEQYIGMYCTNSITNTSNSIFHVFQPHLLCHSSAPVLLTTFSFLLSFSFFPPFLSILFCSLSRLVLNHILYFFHTSSGPLSANTYFLYLTSNPSSAFFSATFILFTFHSALLSHYYISTTLPHPVLMNNAMYICVGQCGPSGGSPSLGVIPREELGVKTIGKTIITTTPPNHARQSQPHPPPPQNHVGVGFVGPSTPFPLREVSKNIRKSEKEKGDVVQCSYRMIPEIQVLGRVCQVTSDPCLSIQCLFLFQGKTEMPTLAHY